MIKLFYKNHIRNDKERIHFDQTFSKWILLICRKMQVRMIFLIKLYYKSTPYSEVPLIKIQVVYLFDAHSFFGFVNLSFQFGTHSLIQHHFFILFLNLLSCLIFVLHSLMCHYVSHLHSI